MDRSLLSPTVNHRSVSPPRLNLRDVSPPPPARRHAGRVGLPGGWRESRSISPMAPTRPRPPSSPLSKTATEDSVKTKESVDTEATSHSGKLPKMSKKQAADLAGTWRSSIAAGQGSSTGLCALWEGGGENETGPLLELLKTEGLLKDDDAEERVEQLEKEKAEAEETIEKLKQALLRCEKIARPHTINAEYKEEWDGDRKEWGTLPDHGRSLDEVMIDAEETVADACGRLRGRTEQALDELCESSQELHKLQSALEEKDARIAELEAECAAAQNKISEQTRLLLEYQKNQMDIDILNNANAVLQADLDAARMQIAKLQFEHDQLRIEVGRLIKRNRAANKRSKDDMLPLYREEAKGQDVRGPAWIPAGAPFRHTLDEEAGLLKAHNPWPATK